MVDMNPQPRRSSVGVFGDTNRIVEAGTSLGEFRVRDE